MAKISEYLSGKTILITGSTGFLGQPLVEKILWSAPQVRRIYLLIRPKRKSRSQVLTAQQRTERELFQSSAFDRLYKRHGDDIHTFLEEKLKAISGDLSKEGLGLDEEVSQRLVGELDIIINSAAVVSFDAPLDETLEMNVLGTRQLVRFARGCRRVLLVHVSTAYVCGTTDTLVPETMHHSASPGSEKFPLRQFGDVEDDIARIRELVAEIQQKAVSPEVDRELKKKLLNRRHRGRIKRRDVLERLRRGWLREKLVEGGMRWSRERGWNDTYTYTKAIAEQLVFRERGSMPTVIIRPSVIESSLAEPSPGWLDGLRMADPLIAAIGKGRLKTLPLNPDCVLDLVPVDMVVNAILAALPRTAAADPKVVEIYQVATSHRNPLLLGELYDFIYRYFRRNPMLNRKGKPIRIKRLKFQTPERFRLRHRLKTVPLSTAERTLERFPVFDFNQKFKRRIAATRIASQKLYYYGEIYEPYLNLDCRFKVDKTLELFQSLSPDERRHFNFDVTRLNWRYYIQNVHIPGVKKFILKIEGAGSLEVVDPREGAPLEKLTIPYLFQRAAQRFPDRTALQIKRSDHWQAFTYRRIDDLSTEIAARFQRFGFGKGDRVVLFSENQPEWAIAYLAAAKVGLTVVPIDAQTWHREAWSIARFTRAKAILSSAHCLKRLQRGGMQENEDAADPIFLLSVDEECRVFALDGFPRSTAPQENDEIEMVEVEVGPDDPASIIFTSGTMADPRGAVHTHANFIKNLLGVNHYLPIYETDQFLSVLPLYHALAFTCGLLMPVYGGATIAFAQTLKPRVLLENMRETGTTCLLGVPTLLAMIRDDINRRVLKTAKSKVKSNIVATSKHFSRSVERTFGKNIGKRLFARIHEEFGGRIRVVVSGGSSLGEDLYDDYLAIGLPIYEGYGLTETAPVLTASPLKRSRRGSAGKPLPGVELHLFNPDRNGVGEIVVQTPCLMKNYFENPQATEKVIRDQWFQTGDLGWIDTDGYVYIKGRTKDVIVTGAGKNVYPMDLEAVYRSLPGISNLCVLGFKSGLTEEVHAAIVPSPDTDQKDSEAVKKGVQREVNQFARELPSYHRLQAIHIFPQELPCDEKGELDRVRIRRWVEERIAGKAARNDIASGRKFSIEERIVEELSRLSGVPVDEIDSNTHLVTDLGLDSLMSIELLLFLDHNFRVSIPDDRASSIETVDEVLEEVRQRLEVRASKPKPIKKPLVRSVLPLDQRPIMDRCLLALAINTLGTFYKYYFDLELHGPEGLPWGKPYIVAANHSSHLDFPAVLSAFRAAKGSRTAKRLHPLAARDYFFDSRMKSWFFSSFLNLVPIEREEASLAGLRLVRSILRNGEPVLIFPEGTRSKSGDIQEFKAGLGLIALELDVPIIPTYIDGTFRAMPKGALFPKRNQVSVYFGEPIDMKAYRNDGDQRPHDLYRQIARDVKSAIVDLSRQGQRPAP